MYSQLFSCLGYWSWNTASHTEEIAFLLIYSQATIILKQIKSMNDTSITLSCLNAALKEMQLKRRFDIVGAACGVFNLIFTAKVSKNN